MGNISEFDQTVLHNFIFYIKNMNYVEKRAHYYEHLLQKLFMFVIK